MARECRNCWLATICKSGDVVESRDDSLNLAYTDNRSNLIVRDCVELTDPHWREEEFADFDAKCIYPDRFVPKPEEIMV